MKELQEKICQEMAQCLREDQRTPEAVATIVQYVEDIVRSYGRGDISDHMWGGLMRWVLFGIEPGDFLQSMLKNDWLETFKCADDNNTRAMQEWSMVVYNGVPMNCRGKYYDAWKERKGLLGG